MLGKLGKKEVSLPSRPDGMGLQSIHSLPPVPGTTILKSGAKQASTAFMLPLSIAASIFLMQESFSALVFIILFMVFMLFMLSILFMLFMLFMVFMMRSPKFRRDEEDEENYAWTVDEGAFIYVRANKAPVSGITGALAQRLDTLRNEVRSLQHIAFYA
jgi:hypothetical protein